MSFEKFAGGTEAVFRGKRRVTLGGRSITSTDESYRRLDPLPDRLQGRKIVVSPIADDDKGKSADENFSFWVFFFVRKSCNLYC